LTITYNAIHYAIVKTPITPGEILLEDYLKPMGISQNAMARAIGVPPRAINEIVLGRRSITPAMSIRFGAFFGQSEGFWHGIQIECDFRALANRRRALVKNIIPAKKLLAA
jgi:addiction module HigA family antidote